MTNIFDGYICGVTGLPCCGCSFYCSNRAEPEKVEEQEVIGC